MGPVEAFFVLLISIAGTVIGGVLVHDFHSYIPRISTKLILRAARRLPPEQEVRYAEEWLAAIGEMEERSAMMAHALSCYVIAVPRIEREIRGSSIYSRRFKGWFDTGLILLATPFVLPVILLLALLVRRDGGPAFYVQDRVGLDGRVFRLWKLRSMVVDADRLLAEHLAADPALRAEWDAAQKLKRDPRITAVGRLLRKTSLDELPQLLNVLKGDMSLVGPRPMMPEQRALYPGRAYYAMRPGLTGPWQVSDRNANCFEGRAEFDSLYRRRMSLPTDLGILLLTVWVVVRDTGY